MATKPSKSDLADSVQIALDAADAATDVTSEYNKTKREHKKLEASVKSVHRFSIIIFASSMVAAVAALMFAGMIYFRTMSGSAEVRNIGGHWPWPLPRSHN